MKVRYRARPQSGSGVIATVADPVGAGFVASLAQPGGNITGFMLLEYSIGT